MKDQIIQTLIQHKYKIEDKISEIEKLEDEPFTFFKESSGIDEPTFVGILEQRDPQYVYDYQRWLFPKLINEIKSRFNVEGYTLTFQPNNFPSPIQFIHEMHIVANIYPFANTISYVVPYKLTELYEKKRRLLIDLATLEEDLAICETIETNPILAGRGKVWHTTKALLNQKSVKKSNKEEAVKLLESITEMNRKLNECNQEIDRLTDEWLVLTLDLDRLINRLSQTLNLTVIDPMQDVEDEEELFYNHELPQIRANYRKELRAEYGIHEDEMGD